MNEIRKSSKIIACDIFLILFLSCRDLGIPAACTVRKNCMDRCSLKTEVDLKAEGRGATDFRMSSEGIPVLKWFDNKVTVASNHYSAIPITEVISLFSVIPYRKHSLPTNTCLFLHEGELGVVCCSFKKMVFFYIKIYKICIIRNLSIGGGGTQSSKKLLWYQVCHPIQLETVQ